MNDTEKQAALPSGEGYLPVLHRGNEPTAQVRFVTGKSLEMAIGLLTELLEHRLQFIEGPLSFADIVTCHLDCDTAPGANKRTITAKVSERFLSLLAALGAGHRELELISKARHGISSCC